MTSSDLLWFSPIHPSRLSLSDQAGDKNSSHSSSNTLSSNASSNSDDKHFGSGDLMDPEMLGLTYIKGASTDSGIDTNPCMAPGVRVLMQGRAGEQGHPWASGHHDDGASEEDHGKLYLPQGYASPILSSQVREGSMGDLSEISSHSRYDAEISAFLLERDVFPHRGRGHLLRGEYSQCPSQRYLYSSCWGSHKQQRSPRPLPACVWDLDQTSPLLKFHQKVEKLPLIHGGGGVFSSV